MADPWRSKIGITGKPLLLGLTQDGALVDFGDLSGPGGVGAPQLRLRQPHEQPSEARSFDVVVYNDPDDPPVYNAQRVWEAGDFTGANAIVPGRYIAEVDAQIDGAEVTFPDDGYLVLEFLVGVDGAA